MRCSPRIRIVFAALLLWGLPRAFAQTIDVPAFPVGVATAGRWIADSDVAAAPDGSFLVIWDEYNPTDHTVGLTSDVTFARRFSSQGVPLGPLTHVDNTGHVRRPVVQADSSGGFTAAWLWVKRRHKLGYWGDQGFMARRFDPLDTAIGGEFQVSFTLGPLNGIIDPATNVTVPGSGTGSTTASGLVVGLSDGFAFIWDEGSVWVRLFDGNGVRRGSDFQISGRAGVNDAAALPDGGFVVSWTDNILGVTARKTWIRAFGPAGQARTDAIEFPEAPAAEEWEPSRVRLAVNPMGGFGIVGTVANFGITPGENRIWARRFGSDGTAQGGALLLHVQQTDQQSFINPDVEFDRSGNLYVAWAEFLLSSPVDWYRWRTRSQGFDRDGNPLAPILELSDHAYEYVRTVRLQDGRFANVWKESGNPAQARVVANIVSVCSAGAAACGDGIREPECGEECDNGLANSDTAADACRTNCRLPFCSDGVIDAGEQCDDGNTQSCDGCSAHCQIEVGARCGDGIRNRACGEECDNGAANSDTVADACRTNCRLPRCGDGVIDGGEQCDDGNTSNCDGCSFQCQLEPPPSSDTICEPLPFDGMTAAQAARFANGRQEFIHVQQPATGLGPIFNGMSCAECHNQPTIGGSSARLVTQIGSTGPSGFDPLIELGGSTLQTRGITTATCSVSGETVPAQATIVAQREAPPLFGLGILEAIPDSQIVRGEDPFDRNHDGIFGHANLTGGRVGRFGWKAQVASLHDFAAQAFHDEMGITTPFFPTENNPQGGPVVCDDVPDPEDDGTGPAVLAEFMRLLAPLPRIATLSSLGRGAAVFRRADCAKCHSDRLKGTLALQASSQRTMVTLYTDVLLHDMGPDLADGIVQGTASGSEFRTPPLVGLRYSAPYLHDGRAATLEAAIAAHGGEASGSRDRFLALSDTQRAALIAFLNSL